MVLSGGPLRANQELTGYGKETNWHQLHGERGWALIHKQLTKEQRRELWLPLYGDGFLSLPILGSESGPCYLGNRDERGLTTHASGKAGPEDWFVVSDSYLDNW